MNQYWDERYDLMYYNYVRYFVRVIGANAESLIDVGSHGAEYVTWFPWIKDVTSLDLRRPFQDKRVTAVKADFYKWEPERTYDLALCLQVLEHVDRPEMFMRKLLAIARHVIVSVPFEWPEGSSSQHVQDPVTLARLSGWAGREPNYYQVVTEPFADRYSKKARRLISYFDVKDPAHVVGGAEVRARQGQTA